MKRFDFQKANLQIDPMPALSELKDAALHFFVQRDLLLVEGPSVTTLWTLPEVMRLTTIQRADGSWKYAGKTDSPAENYSLLETYRQLRVLVEQYALNSDHPTLALASEYIFRCQKTEGDIRGIIGNQYMPYYHGAILELLIKAGYANDERVLRGLDWLLAMRQKDGGWIVPAQAIAPSRRTPDFWTGEPVSPDRDRPHAHLATGMVLRAFAAHPAYCQRDEVKAAGIALKKRFFQADAYHDRKHPGYWLKFQFPFWWSHLLSALDTLFKLGFTSQDADIARGLAWFAENQEPDGLWPTGYDSGRSSEVNRCWVGLAVCRVLRAYFCD